MSGALYRHFNKKGELLYVGMSMTPFARIMAHIWGREWSKQIACIELEHFDDKIDLRFAEKEAVLLEKPIHNINLTQKKTAYLRRNK